MQPGILELLGRMLPSLLLIVGGLLLVRRWSQRGRAGGEEAIRVLARTGVARNAAVAVLAYEGRRFLVGAGEQGVRLLAELAPDPRAFGVVAAAPQISEVHTDAVRDVALARPASPSRPWMGLVHRLQSMTVRTHPDAGT